MHPDWKRLASRPEVAQLAVWDLIFCYPRRAANGVLFASDGDGWLTKSTAVVLAGRSSTPRQTTRAVVNEAGGDHRTIGVGDAMQVRTYAPDQLAVARHMGRRSRSGCGHRQDDRGVLVYAERSRLAGSRRPLPTAGPFCAERCSAGDRGRGWDSALKRDVSSQLARAYLCSTWATQAAGHDQLGRGSFALYMIALAVLLAGGLLVAQVLSRSASFIGQDVAALRAIGMTRRDISAAALMSSSLAICVAVAVGLTTAVALSPLFPLGVGRQVDPDVGVHADLTALGIGNSIMAISLAAEPSYCR